MSNHEAELLDMIRSSKDPAEAAKIAFEVIMQAIAAQRARE